MSRLLFIEASPRAERAITTRMAKELISDLCERDSDWNVDHLNLWTEPMPSIDGPALTAKYGVIAGRPLSAEEEAAWTVFKGHVDRLSAADLWILAVPMWNFGIPYPLKHYIDVVTQPGLTFTLSPDEGYRSLLQPRRAIVVASSAGDYSAGSGNEHHDFHVPYLTDWLELYMGCDVDVVSLGPTMGEPDMVRRAEQNARERLVAIADAVHGRD